MKKRNQCLREREKVVIKRSNTMDICIYVEVSVVFFVNTPKKKEKKKKNEHKRAKDNKEIYSDTRQERNRERET